MEKEAATGTERFACASHLADAARLNIATAVWQVRSRLRSTLVDVNVSERKETIYQELLQVAVFSL